MSLPFIYSEIGAFMGVFSALLRFRVQTRHLCPALLVVIGVTCGEFGAWFASIDALIVGAVALGMVVMIVPTLSRGLAGGILLGLIASGLSLAVHATPLDARDVQLLVQVRGIPSRHTPGEVSFVAQEVLGDVHGMIRCRAIDLSWRNLGELRRGDQFWIRGDVLPVARPANPFSWEAWLWRQGIRGEMKVMFASKPLSRSESFFDHIRNEMVSLVKDTLGDSRGAALYLSMAFGFRDVLSKPVEDMFSSLGLSHLLVVSGYQVSLVFMSVCALLRLLVCRAFPCLFSRHFAIVLSFIVASFYVILVGSEMSALRALIAAACACASLAIDRRHGFFQRWAVALLIMEVLWPWCFFEIGVLLTFAALAGIGIGSCLGGSSRILSLLWVSVCVWLLTSAIVVLWSGTLSIGSIVLNILLAAVWSTVNCTVGGVGILLRSLDVWPGGEILALVALINEEITRALFWLSREIKLSVELEGVKQVAVGALLAFLSLWCGFVASGRSKVRLAQAIVRS